MNSRKALLPAIIAGWCLSLFTLLAADGLPASKQYEMGLRMFHDLGDEANLSVGQVFFSRAAAQGHTDALAAQGLSELLGLGTQFQPVEGLEKIRKAMEQGSAKATFNLAVLASDRIGVDLDQSSFEELLKSAAEKGLPQAQYFYGQYLAERPSKPDPVSAASWMRKASAGGDARATAYLGFLHLKGSGVKQDVQKGEELLRQAEASGGYHPWHLRGEAYLNGFGYRKDISKALDALLKSVSLGCRRSEILLQVLPGDKERVDQGRLLSALQSKARSGDAIANHFLGLGYSGTGKGKSRYEKAAEAFAKGVESKYLPSYSALADLYLIGMGVEQDASRAMELLVEAARSGDVEAEYKLGFLLHRDSGSPDNQRRAFESTRNAALKGHSQAQRLLSLMLANGVGTVQRLSEALAWANIALGGIPEELGKAHAVLKPAMTSEAIAKAEELEQAFRIRLRRNREAGGQESLVW